MNEKLSRFWRNNRVFTLLFLISISCAFLVASATFYTLRIRVNINRSFPLGFYRICDENPERGDLVFIKPPENSVAQWGRRNGAISRPTQLKRIYGMEEDNVEISCEGVRINGVLIEKSKIIRELPDGTLIPSTAQSGVIPKNNVWVMSEHNERSFDSRYFGPVPFENIQSKAKPLWVW